LKKLISSYDFGFLYRSVLLDCDMNLDDAHNSLSLGLGRIYRLHLVYDLAALLS